MKTEDFNKLCQLAKLSFKDPSQSNHCSEQINHILKLLDELSHPSVSISSIGQKALAQPKFRQDLAKPQNEKDILQNTQTQSNLFVVPQVLEQ